MTKPALKDLRRLVIKIGSALLIDADGRINRTWLDSFAEDIFSLRKSGHQVLVVSSGAVRIPLFWAGKLPRVSAKRALK